MNANQVWDYLLDNGIVTEETLQIITSINGYTVKTLLDVLYAKTGYRTIEQLQEA